MSIRIDGLSSTYTCCIPLSDTLCFLYVANRELGLFLTTNCKRDFILFKHKAVNDLLTLYEYMCLFCSSLVILGMLLIFSFGLFYLQWFFI